MSLTKGLGEQKGHVQRPWGKRKKWPLLYSPYVWSSGVVLPRQEEVQQLEMWILASLNVSGSLEQGLAEEG